MIFSPYIDLTSFLYRLGLETVTHLMALRVNGALSQVDYDKFRHEMACLAFDQHGALNWSLSDVTS